MLQASLQVFISDYTNSSILISTVLFWPLYWFLVVALRRHVSLTFHSLLRVNIVPLHINVNNFFFFSSKQMLTTLQLCRFISYHSVSLYAIVSYLLHVYNETHPTGWCYNQVTDLKNVMGRKVICFICPHIYHFWCVSLQVSVFGISCSLAGLHSLCFLWSKNGFISLHSCF